MTRYEQELWLPDWSMTMPLPSSTMLWCHHFTYTLLYITSVCVTCRWPSCFQIRTWDFMTGIFPIAMWNETELLATTQLQASSIWCTMNRPYSTKPFNAVTRARAGTSSGNYGTPTNLCKSCTVLLSSQAYFTRGLASQLVAWRCCTRSSRCRYRRAGRRLLSPKVQSSYG